MPRPKNLCLGQFEEGRWAARSLLIGQEGIGGRFGGDLEYKVVLSQVSPHRLGISPLIFFPKYYLFHLDKLVSDNLKLKAPTLVPN